MAVGIGFSFLALFMNNPWSLSLIQAFLIAVGWMAGLRISVNHLIAASAFLIGFILLTFSAGSTATHAVVYTLRLVVLISATPIFAQTTSPQDLTRSLSSLSLPQGVLMALVLVWRFFPMMRKDMLVIRQAAHLRGIDQGPWMQRIFRGTLIPLIFCAMDYTERLSLALELRGFSPDALRTSRWIPKAQWTDLLFSLSAIICSVVSVLLQWRLR